LFTPNDKKMKSTQDLIQMFSSSIEKGKISFKQAKWLFNVAKKEGILHDRGDSKSISINSRTYFFKALHIPCAAYGGFVGSKGKSGNWSVSIKYKVRFTDTGIEQYVNNLTQLDEYEYEILD